MVEEKSFFVALKGSNHDGADFIREAVANGARVVAGRTIPSGIAKDILCLEVEDPPQFLRHITRRLYGDLASRVKTIGVTGTNGKTTITYLIESIFKAAGKKCGVIGTVNYRVGEEIFPSTHTTPDFVANQRFLAGLAGRGVEHCVMEVSSHGLSQGRVDLIDFKTAVFTNLTDEHLDYHKTAEDYFLVKAKLFTGLPAGAAAIINLDDVYGRRLPAMTRSQVIGYGIENPADVMARNIHSAVSGSRFEITGPGGSMATKTGLVGIHNVYNVLAAVTACLAEGINPESVQKGIESLDHIPGRLEKVSTQRDFSVFIDYAHTEDALKNVLQALRTITPGRIILVFGCGGDRDKTKRPKMGAVAGRLADISIITNDNPRSEDPQDIADQIREGFEDVNYHLVLDREEAIGQALMMAGTGDVVLIAGKGHEQYQIFKDQTITFIERDVIEKKLTCLR